MTAFSIRTVTEIVPQLPARVAVLFRGRHGIGKSQVIRQIAASIAQRDGIEDFEVIDRRLSQMSEGDVIGLPSTDGDVTRFNPPDWYKRACEKPCCLFLDELNRATPEVMQASFQIALDGELNGWKLHPQTRVFSAINASAEYTVNEVDPALLDRFWVVDLEPSVQDWLDWARRRPESEGGPLDKSFIEYFMHSENERWLDPAKDAQPGQVDASRRSWVRAHDALDAAQLIEHPEHQNYYVIMCGFVGDTAAIPFVAFAKTIERQISGEDIVERFDDIEDKIAGLGQEARNTAIAKVVAYVEKIPTVVSEHQGRNLRKFMDSLPKELKISLWQKLIATGTKNIDLARSWREYIMTPILEIFDIDPADLNADPEPSKAENVAPATKKGKKSK